MRRAQPGDHVQVRYVKRFQDGSTASSRGRSPLEVTIGTVHPRLPGLGLALVGLAAGEGRTLCVPPEKAYGLRDPSRVRQLGRGRFPPNKALSVGKWVRILDRRRRRWVRILEVGDEAVIVDINHPWAGLALVLEVELIAIHDSDAVSDVPNPNQEEPTNTAANLQPAAEPSPGNSVPGDRSRAIAFDVDPATLVSLRQAFPKWQVEVSDAATIDSLISNRSLGEVDLLVVGVRDKMAETLGLCRVMRKQPGGALTPILVLVPPAKDDLVRAALEAGATSCLVLPVHVKDLVSMMTRARAGNQPGRHTLGLDQAQSLDSWRDDGGQG